MKIIFVSLITLLWTLTILGQNDYKAYYETRNKAMESHANNKLQEAITIYEKTFTLAYPFPEDMKYLYDCYLKAGDKESAHKTLERMVMCGYKLYPDTLPLVGYNMSMFNERDTNILNDKQFIEEYDSLRAIYLKGINKEANDYLVANSICEYFAILLRRGSNDEQQSIIEEESFLLKKELLVDFLKSDKNVGRQYTDHWLDPRFLLSLTHSVQILANTGEAQALLDLYWNEVLKGNIYLEQWAVFYDNIIYQEGDGKISSVLGFQSTLMQCKDEEGNDINDYVIILKDSENVDKLRNERLLPPLWVYCKLKNKYLEGNYIYSHNK
ncbi:MAG: hypothetical protein LBO06_03855 [Bacteroidales bacterium]|jgi:hypothetical protein|nr:hypothetical protein [Bacteroidales bacterium]